MNSLLIVLSVCLPLFAPQTWNAQDAIDETPGYWRGEKTLEDHFIVSNQEKNNAYTLCFDGVNQEAWVTVNGHDVGYHAGGYTRFSFDITPWVKQGTNTVSVRVSNAYNQDIPPLSADFTFFGGIYRRAYVAVTDMVRIAQDGITVTTPSVTDRKATLQVYTDIINPHNLPVVIRQTLITPSGKHLLLKQGQLTLSNPALWSPDTPVLYSLFTEVIDKRTRKVLDQQTTPVGFRYYHFDPDKGFFLNGQPLKLIGTNRHQDEIGYGNALTSKQHRRDILMIKSMGANFLRVSHYPQDKTVMDMCDSLGIICSVEIPIVNTITENDAFTTNCLNMLEETIRQNRNHPSVIIWAYMNEPLLRRPYKSSTEQDMAYRQSVVRLAKQLEARCHELDSERYTMIAIHDDKRTYYECGLLNVPQIVGLNIYQGWYSGQFDGFEKSVDKAHEMLPDKIIFVTEYGADCDMRLRSEHPERFDYTLDYALLFHRHYLKTIQEKPYIAGSAVWNFNDFHSEARGGAIPHFNLKGLVSSRREPKPTYWFYQSELAKDSSVRQQAQDSLNQWLAMPTGDNQHFLLGANRIYTSNNGTVWKPIPERWINGGEPYRIKTKNGLLPAVDFDILGTDDDPLYQTALIGIEQISIPVPQGLYDVSLYWAELQQTGERVKSIYNLGNDALSEEFDDREMQVYINDSLVIASLNPSSDGSHRAIRRTFTINAHDGRITIRLKATKGKTLLNAISIQPSFIDQALHTLHTNAIQLAQYAEAFPQRLPRTYEKGQTKLVSYKDWTCGFFPGLLWMLYEDQPNDSLLYYAKLFSERILPAQHLTNTHDIGFMLYNGLHRGYQITADQHYLDAMIQGATNLQKRFSAKTGVIQSWNKKDNWDYPVIIDNMLNLELLCFASRQTHDAHFVQTAITHANTTIRNHFRPDYSCFHVVNYDPLSGAVLQQTTYQGYADSSVWARGMAWALYGYTMMYRQTQRQEYLLQARAVAAYLLNRLTETDDHIPYWDFDAPRDQNSSRDASAAACMASALIDLSQLDNNRSDAVRWLQEAQTILYSLSSSAYTATHGEQGGLTIRHCAGNVPKLDEVDVPLIYADYYYAEALTRLKHLLQPEQPDARSYWVKLLTDISAPVINNLAEGSLRRNMPFACKEARRQPVAYLEACGRTVLGLSGWLSLGTDFTPEGQLRAQWAEQTRKAIRHIVDPQSADYTPFDYIPDGRGKMLNQPLVDAAFLAQGILRARKTLWDEMDADTRALIITEMTRSRHIKPFESNWLLFASMVELFLLETTNTCDTTRLMYGINRFMKDGWYKGDGIYGDGDEFRADYYNSFVIHPLLTDLMDALYARGMVSQELWERQYLRQQRYAAIQERQIMPDGSFPVCGRSITYRFACFSQLSQTALQHRLPTDITPAQVRCALTSMMQRIQTNPNIDNKGWLVLGFSGYQPNLGEVYINTGSLYLCTAVFAALGLPATDPFWKNPDTPWTSVKAYTGIDIPNDHALKDSK